MYYNQTGSIPALEEASTHITNYYNECLASKVEAQIGKQAVSFVKSKALNVAKTVAEDLVGVGEVKATYYTAKMA